MDGINIRVGKSGFDYALAIAVGIKTIETRRKPTLDSLIGQRVCLVRTHRYQPARVIGEVTIIGVKEYNSAEEFYADEEKHRVNQYSEFAFEGKAYGYILADPVLYDNYFTPPKGGVVIRKMVK